jgi:hypothetical protein
MLDNDVEKADHMATEASDKLLQAADCQSMLEADHALRG